VRGEADSRTVAERDLSARMALASAWSSRCRRTGRRARSVQPLGGCDPREGERSEVAPRRSSVAGVAPHLGPEG